MTKDSSTAHSHPPSPSGLLFDRARHRDRRRKGDQHLLLNTDRIFGDEDLTGLEPKVLYYQIEDSDQTLPLGEIYRDCKTVENLIGPFRADLVETRSGLSANEIAVRFASHVKSQLTEDPAKPRLDQQLIETVAEAQAAEVRTAIDQFLAKGLQRQEELPLTLQETLDRIDFMAMPGPAWKLALLKYPVPKYRKIGSRKAQEAGEADGPPDTFFQKWYLGAEGDRPNLVKLGMALNDFKSHDAILAKRLTDYLANTQAGYTLGEWFQRLTEDINLQAS